MMTAVMVACPVCGAEPLLACRDVSRPGRYPIAEYHAERVALAMES